MNKEEEEELRRLVEAEAMQLPDLNIAVAGLAGRFPKADSVNEFERLLYEGEDMVNDQDESRFACGLWNLPPRAGRLKDLSRFDSEFFGFTHDEANYIDYQLRILYEVVYESILDAGVNPAELRGSNTGVFFGLHCSEFENAMDDDPAFKGNGYYAQFAVKVAQYFDLRGLTVTFDAACASGFVGLHSAVQALKAGTMEQAIVCSSNIPIHPTGSFIFLQMQMLSPTGYSRFLDSRADGYVKSEACVSVLLQRKHLARRNYASVMATMTSVDGYKREGITFPSDKSQERLIRATKEEARLRSDHVEYLEAHGTGTPAGDPQEARAIASVYFPAEGEDADSKERRRIGPLLVGSVKTNMGHSEGASGLCSLTKVALMLENELIYPGLHYEQPNTNIESLKEGKLKFVTERMDLRGKIVPLSCYGFGGSNVHVIVRANERPALGAGNNGTTSDEKPRLVVMFGRSEATLSEFFDQIMDTKSRHTRHCSSDDFLSLLEQLNKGKIDRLMDHRGFLIMERDEHGEPRELYRSIKRFKARETSDDLLDLGRPKHLQEMKQRSCHLLFPGLGSQWLGMAAGLISYQPFWSTIERLAPLLEPFGVDLVGLLNEESSQANSMCETFVSLVAYQVALVNIIRDQLQINRLHSIVGHSLGEISCAYAAGLFDERETLMVAYHLGKALDEVAPKIAGKMVVVPVDVEEANELMEGYASLRISCINGLRSVTISGRAQEVDDFCSSRLTNKKIPHKPLDCAMALHNELIMDSDVEKTITNHLLRALLPLTDFDRTKTNWISTSASQMAQANAEYFAQSMCKQVDLLKALQELPGDSLVLELGPSGLFEWPVLEMEKFGYAKLMDAGTPRQEQVLEITKSLGRLYQLGATFNQLTKFHTGQEAEFPVRRQTPSLSSLMRWQHHESFFVPRYPIQFSKSSAKTELPVDIMHDRNKFIADHCIEGRILYPATGYLFLIWRVFSFTKRQIYDACFQDVENELVPIEFRDVRLLRACILNNNRVTQIYIHYEEGTGRFEIKEGGSLVVEGYAHSPQESPAGLLYQSVRDEIEGERLELVLSKDDVYKQFRLSGYDYGPSFQNIQAASSDGRRSRITFNGHFAALTDSILQTIFLAVAQYAPSGGLFLPTRFDYVRFQPEVILNKLRQAKWRFDLSEGSLNTMAQREIMTKIMEREKAAVNGGPPITEETVGTTEEPTEVAKEEPKKEVEEEKLECVFETYCDPILGIIVTDGIEMRGIKAMPAPRRLDKNEVLMESYQFVADHEEPVLDEPLTRFKELQVAYARVCDSLALSLLAQLCGRQQLDSGDFGKLAASMVDEVAGGQSALSGDEIESYKQDHLIDRWQAKREEQEEYSIEKNGDRMLLSVLDRLMGEGAVGPQRVKELVQANRLHLMHDLLQAPFASERLMRPVVELVLENSCVKRQKLRLLEINADDGLMKAPLEELMQLVAPQVQLDYSLAHPEPSRLSKHKALNAGEMGSGQVVKTYALAKGLAQLFSDERQQLKDLDLIVYKDISCYSLPKQVIEQNGLPPVLDALNGAVRPDGYVLVAMRHRLTLAERILLSLTEPELVGLSDRDLERMSRDQSSLKVADAKIRHINSILDSRFKLMLREAKRNKMLHLATKSDPNGCTVLLFKRTTKPEEVGGSKKLEKAPVLLRVTHEDQYELDNWLEELKRQFAKEEEDEKEVKEEEDESAKKPEPPQVWLCAVATLDKPVNGLVGMMQAMGKELGWARLRCFYDQHTFRSMSEPVSVEQIRNSAKFQEALRRDLLWNCVDQAGQWGSYRHLTINSYLDYERCLCANNNNFNTNTNQAQQPAAYVNCATRGDLSSFAWFEAPFRHLSAEEELNLVQVAYSALNFRDVMLATGRLPLDAIPLKLAMSDCILGLEFSGVDPNGRRVMGMVSGRGLATRVLCPKETSIRLELPDWLSLRDAATIPVAYATVIMALIYRGRMKRGESLLVHAGSGAVGQAAIRLAQHHGLEIYTTVGTPEKRQFMMEEFGLDEGRVFNSRDSSFEEGVMRATGGRGVDLILNSLADDKLQASVRCLADGGRFLEIGKYDMSVDAPMELFRLDTNKTFHGIVVDKLFDTDTLSSAFIQQLRCVRETLNDGLAKGYIKPIKSTLFKNHQVEEAFRFMATGKHMGKVLIEVDPELDNKQQQKVALKLPPSPVCVPRFQLSPTKSYIVTGGLGGFGLELVKWLVAHGARHLVLAGRSGIRTGYQRVTLERLEASEGAKFVVVTGEQADLCKRQGAEVLCAEAVKLAPEHQVGGLFHLAMVLKDSLLENLTAADFGLVCRPKVEVARHLDLVLRRPRHKLDYFVAFSSVASGKGNAGQTSYAYANSYLERLCERRRARGDHGLAIQWGAIGDVGVAYENLGGNNIVIGGTRPQRMPSCLQTLAKFLTSPFTNCLSVVPVNRGGGGKGAGGERDLVAAIMHVLGIKDPSKVSEQATLGELGLDSLMAVEIRQYIEREYDMTLNIQEIRSLTIAKIREINDKGKSAVKREVAAAAAADKPKEVNSYGKMEQAGGEAGDNVEQTSGAATDKIDAIVEKGRVASFVPCLELPKDDFKMLNTERQGSPLFFLPPIHGEFDKLEPVCAHLGRPCVGLNWTRRLGRAESMGEVVETVLDLLRRTDWGREFKLVNNEETPVVDLVGYSYGATVAFEVMLALHRPDAAKHYGALKPGNLVLLDGSPKQFELGQQFLGSLTSRKPMKSIEKINELLMVYILSHTSKLELPRQRYVELQKSLAESELEDKSRVASHALMDMLGLKEDEEVEEGELGPRATAIGHSMEAFVRKYHMVSLYKATKSLPGDCTLIRAQDLFFKKKEEVEGPESKVAAAGASYNDDLELSSLVQGKVHLFIMPGDHESFLTDNLYEVACLIHSNTSLKL